MDQIREQVKRARHRLSLELFLNRLLRCWFATLILAVVAIAVPKLWAIDSLLAGGLPAAWASKCAIAGLVVATLGAAESIAIPSDPAVQRSPQ